MPFPKEIFHNTEAKRIVAFLGWASQPFLRVFQLLAIEKNRSNYSAAYIVFKMSENAAAASTLTLLSVENTPRDIALA